MDCKMKKYVGQKLIKATPMTRLEYNEYRGWELPSDEDGSDQGYLVEYMDAGQKNHTDHDGYISWSPSAVFDASYQESGNMDFSSALAMVKIGKRMARAGWNGSGMFVFLVAASVNIKVNREPLVSIFGEGTPFTYPPHIDLCQISDSGPVVGVWHHSMEDVMADDWYVVEAGE